MLVTNKTINQGISLVSLIIPPLSPATAEAVPKDSDALACSEEIKGLFQTDANTLHAIAVVLSLIDTTPLRQTVYDLYLSLNFTLRIYL